MNIDLKSFNYHDLDYASLEKEIEGKGMIFVHLSRSHAKAYIRYLKNSLAIEQSRRYGYGDWRVLSHILYQFVLLLWVSLFHKNVLNLDSIRIIKKLRCDWDIEDNGLYRLTFS